MKYFIKTADVRNHAKNAGIKIRVFDFTVSSASKIYDIFIFF